MTSRVGLHYNAYALPGRALFVIDRASNSVAIARAFDEPDFGFPCRLDDNEPQGLERFEATRRPEAWAQRKSIFLQAVRSAY